MKQVLVFLFLSVLLAACGSAASATATIPVPTVTLVVPVTPSPSNIILSPEPSPTLLTPLEGYGPSNFPSNVNPLTGLKVTTPALLERRPLSVKVANQRDIRPQWGLSLADIVFEYYNQEGTSRFNALFYGQDSEMVGSIRSARFFDIPVIRGYKAVFAFGSAYDKVIRRLYNSEFANRLVLETPTSPLKRYDPNGSDLLWVNTAELSAYITARGVENGRQNLDGMQFKTEAPAGGQPGNQVYVRFSGAFYSRWDYDSTAGEYLRFSDTVNDYDKQNEQYTQLTDRLTNQPISAANVVVLLVTYEYYDKDADVVDVLFTGSGKAVAFRDGQAYLVKWQRNDMDVVSLTYDDGSAFSLKPGNTWYEVMGTSSTIQQTPQGWRYTHLIP